MDDPLREDEYARLSEQDRIRFAGLVRDYYRYVFGVCFSMLANVQDAEDATQDVLLKGMLKRQPPDDAGQFRAWIVRVAKNLCIDVLRRRKRQAPAPEESVPRSRQELNAECELEQAIRRLPAELRVPLLLYYFDGQNAKSVAEGMGISHSGACQRLRLARQQLHQLLTEGSRP
jgi:RNA polymerase sigma factor (sigma-70 family)